MAGGLLDTLCGAVLHETRAKPWSNTAFIPSFVTPVVRGRATGWTHRERAEPLGGIALPVRFAA